jgi:3-hydroxyisobutyrate dehydrogenase-like beta-hydroxyacid dehydrogenase
MALAVAEQAAPHLCPHHLFVDVNSASPVTMKHVYDTIRDSGAAAADVAMMGGIPAFLHRVPCLVSGDGARRFKELFEPLGMDITAVGTSFGQASAIKMFRSIFMKGMLALLVEMLNATHQYEVDSIVLDSIRKTMEKNDFLETVRLQVTKGVVNAERMSHEMEAVIDTLAEMDLPSVMASATKDKLEWISSFELNEYFDYTIPDSLDDVLDEMKART